MSEIVLQVVAKIASCNKALMYKYRILPGVCYILYCTVLLCELVKYIGLDFAAQDTIGVSIGVHFSFQVFKIFTHTFTHTKDSSHSRLRTPDFVRGALEFIVLFFIVV